jgi:hypothetical protein
VFIGRQPKDAELKAMVDEAPGPINFTMMLTLFGERLNGTKKFSSENHLFSLDHCMRFERKF